MNLYLEYPPTFDGSFIGTCSEDGNKVLSNILRMILSDTEYEYIGAEINERGLGILIWDYLDPDGISMENFLMMVENSNFTIVHFTDESEVEDIVFSKGW